MKAGSHPDTSKSSFDPLGGVYRRFVLIRKMKKPKETVNLLTQKPGSAPVKAVDENAMVSFYYPEIYLTLVNFAGPLDVFSLPQFMTKCKI